MNTLFLISGPSGSGKTTVMHATGKNKVVTMTTREKRVGEIEGLDYYFVSKKQFEQGINDQQFIEYNVYLNDHYYGLTKENLEKQLEQESAYILVDTKGMHTYKSLYPNATSIFIYTEYESTKKQLWERGGESTDINERLKHYQEEIACAHLYDIVIENRYGEFAETVKKIQQINPTNKNA